MYVLARRTWLVVAVVLFLLVACAHTAWGAAPESYATVTVRPGDSVWSIAVERYPGADTREKVGEILAANDLHDPLLTAGQRLRVPAS